MEGEQFSLCWNNFHNNLSTGFHSLLQDEDLVDVTLAADGRYLKAHKTVLSVCSPYFKELFRSNPCEHPIVILPDVNYGALSNLLQFMYQGEVSVRQDEIPTFMKVAETLRIKGLTDSTTGMDANGITNSSSIRRDSPDLYSTSENKPVTKRVRPPKKIIKPIQQLRPLESPKTVRTPPSVKSPPLVKSPQPPTKKAHLEEPEINSMEPTINPKEEPADSVDSDFTEESYFDHKMDVSSVLDTSLGESSHPTSEWSFDDKIPTDTSSPGTLQCILGKRGNPRLIVDGHVFYKKSTYKGKSFWYCKHSRTSFKCQAVCWTLHGQIVKWPHGHSHYVIPEAFKPEEDTDVPIEKLQEVLIRSSC